MIYHMSRWHICLFLGNLLLVLAAPWQSDPWKAAGAAERMGSESEGPSHVPSEAEMLHETPAQGAAQYGERGFQALHGESSGATASSSPNHLMRDGEPFKVELQGKWAALQSLPFNQRVWKIPQSIDVRVYPRAGEQHGIGNQYAERKLQARSDIRSLYTLAYDYAKEWHVYFQEQTNYNEAGVVSMVEQQLKVIYEDPLLDPEVQALAHDAYELLGKLKYARFGFDAATQVTEMMDKTLSDPLLRASIKSPFFERAPEFLRVLSQLKQNTHPSHYQSDEFCQSISNSWIRKLHGSASKETRGVVSSMEARACLEKIVSDQRIPEWISGEAERAIEHLKRLEEYLARPESPVPPLPIETAHYGPSASDSRPQDELTTQTYEVLPQISAWLLKPEHLRTRSEADMVFYMETNSARRDPLASHLMATITELNNEVNADHIKAQITEVIKKHFNQRQPTAWLVFFSWVAHKAEQNEAFQASLEILDKPMLRIFNLHREYAPVEDFAQAVEELLHEAGRPRTQATRGESFRTTYPTSTTHFMPETFKVELQGEWAEVQKLNIQDRIFAILPLIDVRNYPRLGEETAIGNEYNERKLKARSDIRSLYTLACDYAQDWHVFFQEQPNYNQAGLVSVVEQQLKEIYELPLLDLETQTLAKYAYEILREPRYKRFGIDVAGQVTEMMDKTLSDPLLSASVKKPFIDKASEFLRNLGELEQKGQLPNSDYDEFLQFLSNKWIWRLKSIASKEMRDGMNILEARASLGKIVSDLKILERIRGETKRAMDYLNRLEEYLALPDSPIKPLPQEASPVVDELTHPQSYVLPQISAWLLEPGNLKTCSEADMVVYLTRNSDLRDPLASKLMATVTELRDEANADWINAQITEVIKQHFNKAQPTAWLVFLAWVAYKAEQIEAYHASLQVLEQPLFQIFKWHRDYAPVQDFAQAVEELTFEAGRPRTFASAPRPHDSYQHQAMLDSPTPTTLDPTSPLARRLQHQRMLESPQSQARPPRIEPQTLQGLPIQQAYPSSAQFPSAPSLLQSAKQAGPVQLDPKYGEKAPSPDTPFPPILRQTSAFPLPLPPTAGKAGSSGKETAVGGSSREHVSTQSQASRPPAGQVQEKPRQKFVPPPLSVRKRPGDPLEGPSLASGEITPAVKGDITSRRRPHSPLSQPGSIQQGFTGAGIQSQGSQPQAGQVLTKPYQAPVPPTGVLGKRPGDPLEGPIVTATEATPAMQGDTASRRMPHSPLSQPGSVQQGFTGAGIQAQGSSLQQATGGVEQAHEMEEGVQGGTSGSGQTIPKEFADPESETEKGKED